MADQKKRSSSSSSAKRVSLQPHLQQIRQWVKEGKTDKWIAGALGSTASSVQSLRSRQGIRRRRRSQRRSQRASKAPAAGGPVSLVEGVLDHGEREGWGMWFDPSVAEEPIWREHWADVESVMVRIGEDYIVLEADGEEEPSADQAADLTAFADKTGGAAEVLAHERGKVKWFDAEKGYGFVERPGGEDLFVHRSEVEGNLTDLEPHAEVEYEIGESKRGPVALRVRLPEKKRSPENP